MGTGSLEKRSKEKYQNSHGGFQFPAPLWEDN